MYSGYRGQNGQVVELTAHLHNADNNNVWSFLFQLSVGDQSAVDVSEL
jgi:hypothetical protein